MAFAADEVARLDGGTELGLQRIRPGMFSAAVHGSREKKRLAQYGA